MTSGGGIQTDYELFLNALLHGDRRSAVTVARKYAGSHNMIKFFYDNIVKSSLYRVGELWEYNSITVAAEHLATSISESIMNDLLNFLSNHKSVYTPYLGISECLANVELVNDDFIKPRENYANGNDLSINSVIPTNKAKIKIEPGKKYGAVKSPAFINSERVVERFQEFFYEENGLNITIAEGKCHSVGDINVIFF